MIVDQDHLKLVRTNTLFKSVSDSFLKTFIKPKNFISVKDGTLLYSFDDESDAFYLIVQGEVKIKFSEKNSIERKYLLDFFGEKEILEETKRCSFAVADKDCTLYKIDAAEFKELMKTEETIANNVLKTEAADA